MSWTMTSLEELASRFTASIVSLQTGQPALNISILRLSTISLSLAVPPVQDALLDQQESGFEA
jgi:hypothetical protein